MTDDDAPVVVEDLEAVDVEDADDRVPPRLLHARLHLDLLVDLLHDPREEAVVDRLKPGTGAVTVVPDRPLGKIVVDRTSATSVFL